MAIAALIVVLATAVALLASVAMTRASDRSALWNMGFAVVVLVSMIILLYALAWLITWLAMT